MQHPIPETLTKLRAPRAGAIVTHFELSDEAMAVFDHGASSATALAALMEAGCDSDAIRFLAFGLPQRQAVWWGCLCARETLPEQPEPTELRALAAAEAWVFQPTEENRRAAMAAAEAAGFDTPASWSAVGAFWSGGSMSPPGQPVVPPGEDLTGKAISGAVLLALGRHDPLAAPARLREFLSWGIDIANGGRGRPA